MFLLLVILVVTAVITFGVDQYSVVGVATDYGLDGLGIEYRWGQDCSHPSGPALRPNQVPVKWVLGPISGGKAAETWR